MSRLKARRRMRKVEEETNKERKKEPKPSVLDTASDGRVSLNVFSES
jgi:hypothetical protein